MSDRFLFLCFLTDEARLQALCTSFWTIRDGAWAEKLDVLVAESGLGRTRMLETIASSCQAYHLSLRCHDCGVPHLVRGRSWYSPAKRMPEYLPYSRDKRYRCTACQATVEDQVEQAALAALQEHRDRVAQALGQIAQRVIPVDYAALDYALSFFLYSALVAANVEWESNLIAPLESHPGQLAPTADLTEHVYSALRDAGLIYPAPCTDPSAMRIDDNGEFIEGPLDKISWSLAPDVFGRSMREVFTLLLARVDDPEPDAVTGLWSLIAQSECRRYFKEQCARYSYIRTDLYTEKVADAIHDNLAHLSIGQMWNIIYYVIKDLAALSQRKGYTRQHVYDMIPANIRRYVDNRLGNNRSIHPWRRRAPISESWMTSILLDKVLGNGDAAFAALTGQSIGLYLSFRRQVEEANTFVSRSEDE